MHKFVREASSMKSNIHQGLIEQIKRVLKLVHIEAYNLLDLGLG
jgi:hypothetical protein